MGTRSEQKYEVYSEYNYILLHTNIHTNYIHIIMYIFNNKIRVIMHAADKNERQICMTLIVQSY